MNMSASLFRRDIRLNNKDPRQNSEYFQKPLIMAAASINYLYHATTCLQDGYLN